MFAFYLHTQNFLKYFFKDLFKAYPPKLKRIEALQ